MTDMAIQVNGLGKAYRIGAVRERYRYQTLRDSLTQRATAPLRALRSLGKPSAATPDDETFWALHDISFEVNRGDVLGLIGHNGSGKSTLLKILSRITEPTEGGARVYGRVGSLLEVGTGFHPELSGRENVFLNGAILGMRRHEIEKSFDEIVAFSEIEKFIDTPVKHYSSGMYLRLAFSVAAHLEPEILLVDEVLAVGDAAFQKKCLGKMNEVAEGGRTIIFVSHNLAAIESLCTRGIVLERGKIQFSGTQHDAISSYLSSFRLNTSLLERTDRKGTGEIKIASVEFRDQDGRTVDAAKNGEPLEIVLNYVTTNGGYDNPNLRVGVWFKTLMDTPVFRHNSYLAQEQFGELGERGSFVLRLPNLPLTAQTYRLMVTVGLGQKQIIDWMDHAAEITVIDADYYGVGVVPEARYGPLLIDGEWRHEPAASPEPEQRVK